MRNRNGFTLIELLAVIVVLAIIALITIPQVLGMTDKAKESANLRSVEGHIENMNNSIASLVFESGVRDGIYTFDEFNFSTFPKKDHIRCEKYEVKKSTIVKAVNCLINDKKYCYDNEGIVCDNMYESGEVGTITWNFDYSTKTLTISGSGDMENYTLDNPAPWSKHKNDIKKIKVLNGVTYIGDYAFYDFTNVEEIYIDAQELKDLSGSGNTGANYVMYHVGTNGSGIKLTFGPNVTRIPAYFMLPTDNSNDKAYVTDLVFETKSVRIAAHGLSYLSVPAVKLPEVTTLAGLGLGSNYAAKFIVMGDGLINYIGWSLAGNNKAELVLLGDSINQIGGNTFRNYKKLNTLVIPHIANPLFNTTDMFYGVTSTVNVYGDSSVERWVDNVNTTNGTTNIIYHDISGYRPTITSNTGITGEVEYNGTYQFTAPGNVEIKQYYDATDGNRYYVDADYTKDGNTYTITKIKANIDIKIN